MTSKHGYLVWTKRETGEVVQVAELGPPQPAEGVVVGGYHPMVLAGMCLICSRPDYAPGCKGEGAVEPEAWQIGPPD